MMNLLRMKKFFYILSVLVCLLGVSVNAWANNYYKIRVVAVYASGETPCPGKVFSYPYSGSGITYSESLCVASEFTTPTYSTTGNPDVYICAADVAGVAEFLGWYTDPACTTPAPRNQTNPKSNQWGSNSGIAVSTVEAEAPTTTFYAKFVKPSVDWTTYAAAPSAGKYYIFGLGYNALVGTTSGLSIAGTKETNNALLFTFTSGTTTTMSCVINGTTYYLNQNSNALEQTDSPKEKTFEAVDGGYNVNLHRSSYSYWEMEATGRLDYENKSSNTTLKWLFIPEATFNTFVSVESLNENGSVTITESPTASGTAYVKFNVSEIGPTAAYNYALSGGDGNWVLGNPTRSGNVLTVPVTYTAQNVHPVGAASTVTVTVTDPASNSVSGTATAYVDLQPTFNMAVSELDWSYDGEDLVETYYVGMEIAASQRERLQNKLVYNASTTNAIAKNNATWTATITGEDAEQFKFANGTREVSGSYTADLMDVIFAPQATGEFTATLHVVVNYEDANHTNLVAFKDVTLKGKGELKSLITFAVDGSEESSNNESHNFGDIIGTNSKTVTADLFMVGLTSPTKVWSDPAGVFEFDESSIDFSKKLQTLTFNAHRPTPIAAAADHTATLTISGTGTEGPVSAVLTLTYHALPLTQTTVTWNWATLGEYVTATNPITTNSDGAWTLTKTAGDAMTYDAEAKSVTTDYLHHEPGHTGTFSLSIPQTDTYTAFNQTYTATIDAIVPPVIEINSQEKFDTYVEGNSWVEYDAATNAVSVVADNVYFKWSGQSTFAFDFYMSGSYESSNWKIKEMYKDGTVREIYNGPFYNGQHHEFAIASNIDKLWLNGNNDLRNVRYFEYDTIAANYEEVVLLDDDGSIGVLDVNVTTANKKALTVSLNSAAQPYFELRATGKSTGSSITFDGEDGLGVHKTQDVTVTIAAKAGLTPAQVEAAKTVSANNECKVIFADNYTYNQETLTLPIRLIEAYDVTYKKHAHGTYKVTYADDTEHPQTVSSADFVKHLTSIAPEHTTVTISAPTPASGYVFQGWKINDVFVSCQSSVTKQLDEAATVEPVFAVSDGTFKIDDALFSELNEALAVAGAIADQEPVVVLMKDLALTEPATYTIPAKVTLLIPYKANFSELQEEPEVTTTAAVLSAYRTLTLKEGVNIICNGNICVSGKIMAAGGGNKSAYTTGPCGVINMANGGHIEMNNGSELYCWGYIKGQDMDQGNNTQDVGTITVNNGAMVHENFELGDWRGGTATSNIYFEKDEKMLFPFQSYALQNVEIPTTYKYGAKLNPYMVVHTGYGDIPFVVSIIGAEETLFLLKDEQSVIRKWYDPTTDLTCYELSGTAQLDQLILNLPFVGEFASGDCNLPISNSMHILLANCDMTLSKPLTVQAGAIVEIKNTATVNLTAKVHLFDVDQWDKYIHNYYFRSFNNLTSHKDRGAENSKAGLDDAKFIIDGTLKVAKNQGYIYSTAGGANLMGNGGGKIIFEGALPGADELWQVYVLSGSPYITWNSISETAANLCNEDGSYTKSSGFKTYYNINGRWFYEENKDPIDDHTYDFYYLDNGNTGDETWTAAVYSHDKTGLEARTKWFNVEADNDCSNWWKDASNYYYNYTMLNEWHQFIETETENVYSCSNNVLYTKDGCNMVEAGFIDENCLYTIGGVKKALVDGHFIPLISNGYDPAYHNNDESKYYICFSGCNWHEATPYPEESKAYTINPETDVYLHYIWFEDNWLNVEREEPYFYTADEVTNVKTYYEYVDGEWLVATPFIRVTDALETREFYWASEALTVAALKKNATITLLRDVHADLAPYTFNAVNTNCTLDLNGHALDITVTGAGTSEIKMFAINMGTGKFTITDNSEYQLGEFRLHANPNTATQSKRWYGIYLTAGELVINAGKVYVEDLFTYTSTSNAGIVSAVAIAGGQKFTLDGNGEVEAKATYNTYGVHLAGSTNTTGKTYIKGGTITASTTNTTSTIGLYIGSGTAYVSGGTINALTKTNTSRGIYVDGTTNNYIGHLEMTGGTINAKATTTTAIGIYVAGNYTFNATKPNTIKATFRGVANISGGTINSESLGTTTAYGVQSLGTTTITGGTFNVKTKTTTCYGLFAQDGTTTISGSTVFNVNATTTTAYGIYANGATPADKTGRPYNPVVTVNGGIFNVATLGTTAGYGIVVNGATRKITSTSSGYYAGNYASAGTVTVNDGIFNVTTKTKTCYDFSVAAAATQSGATGYDPATATPRCTVNGGYFKTAGTGTVNVANTAATTEAFQILGGYYTHTGNLATYANPQSKVVVTLPKTDPNYPTYKYEVATGYAITFMNGETSLQATNQKAGTAAVYSATEPTKANTETNSYIFDGWATEADGEVVYAKGTALPDVTADATYYAHFEETTLKCKVTFNANGGTCATEFVYVTPGAELNTAISALPYATRTGYTQKGNTSTAACWYTAKTGSKKVKLTNVISADVTYYAQWTANKHNLTWNLEGGIVTTAGTAAEVDATGSPTAEVAFAAVITAPVVAKAGYTFVNWGVPTVAAKMPDNDLSYSAAWTPNTNTAYVVKHFKQNLDGTYPEEPAETDELTGTTEAYVTPDTKSYVGYVTPAKQTVQILADGSLEVIYQYELITYTIAFDANGGELIGSASRTVRHGATLGTLPGATKDGANCIGWFTKAIGGDQITESTVIQRNIGTLYAQYDALNVIASMTISEDPEVTDLRITTTGSLTMTVPVSVKNFILESNGSTASGQFLAGSENLTFEHAYFDLKLNAKNHQWYPVAVPWPVNATNGISVKGRTLTLGVDFDIIYYDGARRAAEGKQKCWQYVQNDGDQTLVPGRLYMIGLMGDAATVRFEKKDGVALLTTTTSVEQHTQTTGDDYDAGWNGVANPALFHAFVNPGVTEGQVFVPDENRYELIPLNTSKFVVGEGAFVQVASNKDITVVKDGAFAAPRRVQAQANLTYDVRIAPVEADYTDRLFIKTTDSRDNMYTVGQDLAKVGVSSKVAQMWIDRYDAKLCVNTAEWSNNVADYPLGISVPANGEYTIHLTPYTSDSDYTLYLTYYGEAIWNLSEEAYTLTLDKGTTNEYGLRIVAKVPQVATGVDEALIDAQGKVYKVMINNQIFIIRGNEVYTIDGQLVK